MNFKDLSNLSDPFLDYPYEWPLSFSDPGARFRALRSFDYHYGVEQAYHFQRPYQNYIDLFTFDDASGTFIHSTDSFPMFYYYKDLFTYVLGQLYAPDRWKSYSTRLGGLNFSGIRYDTYLARPALNIYLGRIPVQSPAYLYQGNKKFKRFYGPLDFSVSSSSYQINWPLLADHHYVHRAYDFIKHETAYKSFIFTTFFSMFDINFTRQFTSIFAVSDFEYVDGAHPLLSTALIQFKGKLYMAVSSCYYQNASLSTSLANFTHLNNKHFLPFSFEREYISTPIFQPYLGKLKDVGLFRTLRDYYYSIDPRERYLVFGEHEDMDSMIFDNCIFIEIYDEVRREIKNVFKAFENALVSGDLYKLASYKRWFVDQYANCISTYADCYSIREVPEYSFNNNLDVTEFGRHKVMVGVPFGLSWEQKFDRIRDSSFFSDPELACQRYLNFMDHWNMATTEERKQELLEYFSLLLKKYEFFDRLNSYIKAPPSYNLSRSLSLNAISKNDHLLDAVFDYLTFFRPKDFYQTVDQARFYCKDIFGWCPYLFAD